MKIKVRKNGRKKKQSERKSKKNNWKLIIFTIPVSSKVWSGTNDSQTKLTDPDSILTPYVVNEVSRIASLYQDPANNPPPAFVEDRSSTNDSQTKLTDPDSILTPYVVNGVSRIASLYQDPAHNPPPAFVEDRSSTNDSQTN